MPGRKLQTLRAEWNSEENKDVVIMHSFPRNEKCPSPSPFTIKLETFFRINDIKYKPDFEFPRHPDTGKCPWITYNGEDVADSQMIIEYFTEKLNLKTDVKKEDKILARGLRSIVEDNLHFCRMSEMYVHGSPEDVMDVLPTFVPVKAVNKFICKRVVGMIGNMAKAQGMGKHKKETMIKIADEDLETLSCALGDKPYLLGNEPADIDAVVFGFLAHITSIAPESHEIPKLVEKRDNLKAYVERIKERYWSDWDELCQKAAEAKSPKKKEKKEDEEAKDKEDKKDDDKKDEDKKDEEKKEENGDDNAKDSAKNGDKAEGE